MMGFNLELDTNLILFFDVGLCLCVKRNEKEGLKFRGKKSYNREMDSDGEEKEKRFFLLFIYLFYYDKM